MRFRVACALVLLSAAPAAAGQLNAFEIDETSRWSPSDCSRPTPPPVGVIDNTLERNNAVRAFNAYLQDASEYLKCAVAEANEDMSAFRKIVSESVESEQAAIKAESEQLKATIESGGRK